MKISRKKIKSNTVIPKSTNKKIESTVKDVSTVTDEEVLAASVEEAKTHIMSAIDSLGKSANLSMQSKEAIANLSVVYFDLQ